MLSEERGFVAIISFNRPAELDTRTKAIVEALENGIGRTSRSRDARPVVLRGEGRLLTAGYDFLRADGANRLRR